MQLADFFNRQAFFLLCAQQGKPSGLEPGHLIHGFLPRLGLCTGSAANVAHFNAARGAAAAASA